MTCGVAASSGAAKAPRLVGDARPAGFSSAGVPPILHELKCSQDGGGGGGGGSSVPGSLQCSLRPRLHSSYAFPGNRSTRGREGSGVTTAHGNSEEGREGVKWGTVRIQGVD